MSGRLLLRFLLDRLPFIAAFYTNTALLLLLVWLLLSFEGRSAVVLRANLGYALLLSTLVLTLWLGLTLLRWLPFARKAAELLDEGGDLEALTGLPEGGDGDQESLRRLLDRFFRLAVAERQRYAEAHQRHLAFINLWVHQMKSPVSTISLIAQQGEAAEPAAMGSILEETTRLADGLELVLNTARLQDFAVDYQIRQVDLLESVRKLVGARKKQFIRLAIFPELEASAGEWRVRTDEKWNGFAIDQVIANALKYSSQDGAVSQRLRIRLERQPGAIHLSVADQGPGIPEQDLGRVFEPFFTGENGRRYGGATGIGLYLVRQVMEQMGHRVSIDSKEGEGTVVTFTYPDPVQ